MYLWELDYVKHRQFQEKRTGRVQQQHLFHLQHRVSDRLLAELTAGSATQAPPTRLTKRSAPAQARSRRPATLSDLKEALSYVLGRLERTLVPAHQNYQIRLKRFFETRDVSAEWERDFVDVRFAIDGKPTIGEIKVTTTLRLSEAFRTALGQLLEYAHLNFDSRPNMVMFLDQRLDDRRLALASRVAILVVAEVNGEYVVQNPEVNVD